MREIELKFHVPAERAAAVEAALRRMPSKRATIESHYCDTDDGRLAAAGLALRLRKTGRVWEQTLKAAGGNAIEREEETVPRPGRWGPPGPPIDPGLHRSSRAGALLQAALKRAGSADAALRPVCTTTFSRLSVELDSGGSRVEIAFDRGTIRAGEQSVPICELECELKAGTPRALIEIGRAGVLAHGLRLSTISKFARGERLSRGVTHGTAVSAEAPCLDPTMPGPALEREAIKACLDQVLANASEVVAGSHDDETIHQLRVGLRRLRTAARELGRTAGNPLPEWEVRIAEVFRDLGRYRDRETIAGSLQTRLAEAGSPEPALVSPDDAAPDPAEVVAEPEFQCALLDILEYTLEPQPTESDASAAEQRTDSGAKAAARRLRARLDTLHRELKRHAKRFERLDEAAQHRVRKRLKRLRYLSELVASLFDRKKVERYLERLKPAQDALGAHTDLVVGLRMARDAVARGDAQAWFNVGWLTAAQSASAADCRKALAQASEARRFWPSPG